MSNSLMDDAFGHHTWATVQIIDACLPLTPEQLDTTVAGTYGSIIETLRHLVGADSWYLFDLIGEPSLRIEEDKMTLPELRSSMETTGAAWLRLLAKGVDPDEIIHEVDEDDGYERDAPMSIRLAQALDHGTTHRIQICTVLTTLGIEAPQLDAWDFGLATGRVTEISAGS